MLELLFKLLNKKISLGIGQILLLLILAFSVYIQRNIFISTLKNALFFEFFYNFLKNKIFNNNNYKKWVQNIIDNKRKGDKSRYEHGIYSNQMIYAYFITQNSIDYKNVLPMFSCSLSKQPS